MSDARAASVGSEEGSMTSASVIEPLATRAAA
jgi:hypothetical protein